MALIDLLLNLAGLIFWHGWRVARVDRGMPGALTLSSNLRPTGVERPRRWSNLGALTLLLLIRPFFYWHLGSAAGWTAAWSPGPVTLFFRSDFLGRMFLFSFLSFGWALFVWHAWLTLLSAVQPRPDTNFVTLGVREHLGPLGRWPWPLGLVLPVLALGFIWWASVPGLAALGLMPLPKSNPQTVQQAVLVALSLVFTFRWLLTGVFVLRLLNTYVYFGSHPFWAFIHQAGRVLLWPINWLRVGKLDLAPLVGLVVVWWLAPLGIEWARRTFQSLPLPWP